MKANFGSPVTTENFLDGGLYMLGAGNKSFVGLALCRSKKEYVINLSPTPGNRTAPGLEPIAGLHAAAASLSHLNYELVLSPRDVKLDAEAPSQPGELTVIGEHYYLCFTDEDGAENHVTFGTGQIQRQLPQGPRNRYQSWELVRQVAGQREVLARFPYTLANVTLLAEPVERRVNARPTPVERRRGMPAKPKSAIKRDDPRSLATPPMPLAKSSD